MKLPMVSIPTLPVVDDVGRFPVRRFLCIGRNYADHAREMGATGREAPFHFTKCADALLAADGPVELPYPVGTRDLHHEIEIVIAMGRGGAFIAPEVALDHVFGYALGLDMTRRDLQNAAKGQGRPWAIGKDFDNAAVVGPIVPAEALGHPTEGALTLFVNGSPRQQGDLDQLIWGVPELIAQLSSWMTLHPGDMIFTGTPAGVGPVAVGDRLVGTFPGLPRLQVSVVERLV
jgi:fumarylpyruvate hydrolase